MSFDMVKWRIRQEITKMRLLITKDQPVIAFENLPQGVTKKVLLHDAVKDFFNEHDQVDIDVLVEHLLDSGLISSKDPNSDEVKVVRSILDTLKKEGLLVEKFKGTGVYSVAEYKTRHS